MKPPILYSAWYKNFPSLSEYSIKEFIRSIREAYFDGIELSVDYPLCFNNKVPKVIAEALRHEGLYLSVHMPWRDIHLASPIDEVRETSTNLIIKCMKSLAEVKPKYFIIHLTTEQDYCGYMNRECVKAAKESLARILSISRDLGIPTLIETTHEKCCSNEHSLPYVLSDFIDEDYLGVCLDPIHLISRNLRMRYTIKSITELIRNLPPIIIEKVEELHIHGFKELNYGLTYVHLIPSDDLINEYIEALSLLKGRAKMLVFEVYKDINGRDIAVSSLRQLVREFKERMGR